MSYFFKKKEFFYLLLTIGSYLVISITNNRIFVTEAIISQWYDGLLNRVQIHEIILFAKKWEWGIILLNILIVFIKIACVSVCLYLGLFFFSDQNSTYKVFFNVALKAEIVFVAYSIVRLLWYIFVHTPESIEEMQVIPFSLMSFFDPAIIQPWLIYPLNTLNIFEVLYILMLSALIAVAIQIKFRKAIELVFVSYGAGLLLLMVAQMFLILNNT
jgi:hypothetical protein